MEFGVYIACTCAAEDVGGIQVGALWVWDCFWYMILIWYMMVVCFFGLYGVNGGSKFVEAISPWDYALYDALTWQVMAMSAGMVWLPGI